MAPEKLVVGIAGLAGSGKSLVVNVAVREGYAVVVMGDEVRAEAKKRNLELTPENLGRLMLELRQKEGNAAIAKRCIQKIKSATREKVVVDGVRSLDEVAEFKKHFPNFTLIAVHSSPETRFKRLYHRQRSDDPQNWQTFQERDLRELGVGLGNAIALAEHVIVNEATPEQAKAKAAQILKKVEARWKKQ
ncbi:MAG: AAA family ATPase [Candidatus Bathyarchaeia archaeon]